VQTSNPQKKLHKGLEWFSDLVNLGNVLSRVGKQLPWSIGILIKFEITLCLKKVSTFYLSVTSSNLNRFSIFCIAGKRTKFATGRIWQCPPHLRYVATLPWESKTSNFLQIWKKTRTDCIAVIEDLEHVLASLKRFWGWSIVSPLGGAEPLGEPDTLNLKSHNSVTPWVNISKF